MWERRFRVNIYDVRHEGQDPIPFEKAISIACKKSLRRRGRDENEKHHRLENHKQKTDRFLLNFVTLDFPGPGRAKREGPVSPFGLDEDESYTHETAILYDIDNRLAFIESKKVGMGYGAIARYFTDFAGLGTAYQLIPRLDPDAATRARKKRLIRGMQMRVGLGPITRDHANTPSPIVAFGNAFGASFVDVEIKIEGGKHKSLSLDRISEFLRRETDYEKLGIQQLKVNGKESEEESLELIDLLQHPEKRDRNLPVDPVERKILHEYRWGALEDICRIFRLEISLDRQKD